MNDILHKLAAPLAPEKVRFRVGPMTKDRSKGMALAYLDARDVMERLDAVCGHTWQARYTAMHDGSMCCEIGLHIDGLGYVWRGGGAPPTGNVDGDQDAREMAIKGGYSDAFKRAAVLWGIGRYLYDLPTVWVAIDERKQIVAGEMSKLRASLPKPATQKSAQQIAFETEWYTLIGEINAAIPQGLAVLDDVLIGQHETVKAWPPQVRDAYQKKTVKARQIAQEREVEDAAA